MSKAQELLNVHIQFELNHWKGEKANETLKTELQDIYKQIKDLKIGLFLNDKKKILDFSNKFILSREMTKEEEEIVNALAKVTHEVIGKNKDSVPSILSKETFTKAVNMGIKQKELRRDIIHNIINSAIYTKMISKILFTGIKDFTGENGPAKNIPGASSLLKMGSDFFSNIGVQDNIDKQLTKFIEENVGATLKQSESILNQEIDAKTSNELIEELWKFISAKKISDLQEYSKPEEIDTITSLIKPAWNHFKKSSLFTEILEAHVDFILARYKDKTIAEMLALYNISVDDSISEIARIAGENLAKPEVQAVLENKIKARLTAFYTSKEALAVLK